MENGVKKGVNFAALSEEYSSFKRSKVAIVQAPYDRTATYKKGTVRGPQAILEASAYLELFDDQLHQETYKVGLHTMEELPIHNLPEQEMINRVKGAVSDLLKAGKFPVLLGGEHSVSVGSVEACKENSQDLSVLYLDAHYDLRDELKGSRLNHGCAARRMSEFAPVVEVGTRSLSKEEKDFLNSPSSQGRVNVINVYDMIDDELWKDRAIKMLSKNVYISIDLDVFDPSIMPAVGTPEPGGIGWYEFIEFMYSVIMERNIVGMDVVELCPIKDQPASDFFAAKMIYRLLGYMFSAKRPAQFK